MFAEKNLRKHVAIIHAYSMMSALQRKIVNVLLYEAFNAKLNHNGHSVSIECRMSFSKLSKAVNFNSHNTRYLKEAIDGLASLKIEWNLLKDKAPTDISFLNLRVLHGAPTFYQDGFLNFSFHKLMLDLVSNPLIYGTINLDIQSLFESKYGHSLYENSTRFVNLHKSKLIQLETFRKLLGVHENTYPTMREFTRNVIKPSVEEVNDRAEFVVHIDSIKTGKKITGFELSVKNKKQIESINHEKSARQDKPGEYDKTKEAILKTFGIISESVLENIVKNYSQDYILEKIEYTKQYAKKDKNGLYPVPYFISAIRDDYKSNVQQIHLNERTKLTDHEHAWQQKLQFLQNDFNHWHRHLEYAETCKNDSLIKNTKTIILQCEERLQQHLLNKPSPKLKEELN